MDTKKKDRQKEKLFGVVREQLKLVTGGGGVIIQAPRELAADEGDGGVIIQRS